MVMLGDFLQDFDVTSDHLQPLPTTIPVAALNSGDEVQVMKSNSTSAGKETLTLNWYPCLLWWDLKPVWILRLFVLLVSSLAY